MLDRPDRDHDVLLALVEVCHRRSSCAGGKLCFPDHCTGRFVVSAELLAASARRRPNIDRVSFADEQKCLGQERGSSTGLADRGQLQCSSCAIRTVTLDRGWREEWTRDIALHDIDGFGAKFGREVDQIINRDALPFKRSRSCWERLRR